MLIRAPMVPVTFEDTDIYNILYKQCYDYMWYLWEFASPGWDTMSEVSIVHIGEICR